MKKLFISLFMLLVIPIFTFAEQLPSVSLSLGIGRIKVSNNDEYNTITNSEVGFNFGYYYLFNNGLLLGGDIMPFFSSTSFGNSESDLYFDNGKGCKIKPSIGYRIGKRHLINFVFSPIICSFESFNSATARTHGYFAMELPIDIKMSRLMLSTSITGNFNFGNKFSRSGFFINAEIPWYSKSTSELLGVKDTVTDSTIGITVCLGYKMFMVF